MGTQITWQGALDWTQDMLQRRRELTDRSWALAQKQAAAVHPETGGNWLLVHNWGNDTAKRAWQRQVERSNRIYNATNAAYSRVWEAARKSLA